MKKLLLLITTLFLTLGLAACGGTNSEEQSTNQDNQTESENTEETNKEETEDKNNKSEVSDTTLDTGDYVYTIKEVEQITSKYDDTQILAVEIEFTNNSDEPTSPWMAMGITAEQETDVTVETLNGANGLFPDDYKPELVEMGDTDIKPGATVDAVIGFEILYPGEPVKLSEFSFTDDVSFERIVETNK